MVSRWEAKHLILLSRSGLKAKGALDLVKDLKDLGATVEVVACDVTNSRQFGDILDRCSESCPLIRRVIQGAMVLQV